MVKLESLIIDAGSTNPPAMERLVSTPAGIPAQILRVTTASVTLSSTIGTPPTTNTITIQ